MAILTKLVCVKNLETGEIKRIAKFNAQILVNSGKWAFCPKSEWKAQKHGKK